MHLGCAKFDVGNKTLYDVVIAHDYLTQRGGAERVALAMSKAFPGSPLFTSLYNPDTTFAEFDQVDVQTSCLNRVGPLRSHHRASLPLLPAAMSRMHIDAKIVVASSSGWAHAVQTSGKKIVYCHAPARWLYQSKRYLGFASRTEAPPTSVTVQALLSCGRRLKAPLVAWDRKAARSADFYIANSTITQRAIESAYGISAPIIFPPVGIEPDGPTDPVEALEPGFLLCVARLLPYKNLDFLIETVIGMDGDRLVLVGAGPDLRRLLELAGQNRRITFLQNVTDRQLRWLYASASALVAASFEDFGLSPIEAAVFGKPSVVLRYGGYLDTVVDGLNGVYFERLEVECARRAIRVALSAEWDSSKILSHSRQFLPKAFGRSLHQVVGKVIERDVI